MTAPLARRRGEPYIVIEPREQQNVEGNQEPPGDRTLTIFAY